MASPNRLSVGTMDESLPLVRPTDDASPKIDSLKNNIFFRQSGIKTTLVGLRFPCALYFQGILELNVICGSALINGYLAPAGDRRLPLRVFSMKEGSAYCIAATNSDVSSVDLKKFHVQLQPVIRDILERIRPSGGCVICVSPRTSQYTHWKEAFRRHQLDFFPDRTKAGGLSLLGGAEKLVDSVLDIKGGSRIARKLVMSEELVKLSDELTSESMPGGLSHIYPAG